MNSESHSFTDHLMRRLVIVVALLTALLFLLVACSGETSGEETNTTSSTLRDRQLQATLERVRRGEMPPAGVDLVDGDVRVEVITDGSTAKAREAVVACGGAVLGESAKSGSLDALVPLGCLIGLEGSDAVELLRPLIYVDPAK